MTAPATAAAKYSISPLAIAKIKESLLEELKAVGYAPNPKDVNGQLAAIVAIVEDDVNGAAADAQVAAPAPTVVAK